MMTDTYTVECLKLWASWRIKRDDGGTGYPTKCAFVGVTSNGGFWTPELDSQCYVIDAVVCSLIAERKEVLMAYYTQAGTNEQKAKQCSCSLRTFYTRVELAQNDVFNLLNDKKYRRL